jgi:hypothetical protein
MGIKRLAGIVILIVALVMGCSGNYGKLKTQNESKSKITQQELIDNWAKYNVYFTRYYTKPPAARLGQPSSFSIRKIAIGKYWLEATGVWLKIRKRGRRL